MGGKIITLKQSFFTKYFKDNFTELKHNHSGRGREKDKWNQVET